MDIKIDDQSQYDQERRILCYMITNTQFIKDLQNIAKPKLFNNQYSKHVATWLWEYFDQTKEAPGKHIEDIFISRKSKIVDADVTENISSLLKQLSNDWARYKITNITYSVKEAVAYFKLRSLENLKQQLESAIDSGDALHGESLLAKYSQIAEVKTQGVDIMKDTNKVYDAFNNKDEILLRPQGALNSVIGPILRGDLMGIVGPTGIGKSWCMWYLAQKAANAGLNVVFINLEMTERQLIRRAWQSFVAKPQYNKTVTMPYYQSDGQLCRILTNDRKMEGLASDWGSIKLDQNKFLKYMRGGSVTTITLPRISASCLDIHRILDSFEFYRGIIPDVVIVDYADILKASYPTRNTLEDENRTWMELAGLAMERDCAVITATQGNRDSWEKDFGRKGIGGTYDKISHVSKLIALQQTEKDKELNIMRIRNLKERNEKQSVHQALVLQCLDIGRWYLDSRLKKEVVAEEKKRRGAR